MRKGSLVLLVLLAPTAAATTVEGDLELPPSFLAPRGARIECDPFAIFSEDAASLRIDGGASDLVVRVFEDRYVTVQTPAMRPVVATTTSRPTWTLHEVEIAIAPGQAGWVGVAARDGRLVATEPASVEIHLAQQPRVGNGMKGPADEPEHPYYSVSFAGAAFVREATRWDYMGAAAIKIMGPTLTLRARENTTTIETGDIPDPSNPAERIRRHVVLEAGELSLAARAVTHVASPSIDLAWTGAAELPEAEGTLTGGARAWNADGGTAVVDGEFRATLTPAGGDRIRMALHGDLASTTLDVRVRAGPVGGGSWALLGLLAAVLASAGVGVALRRRIRGRRAGAPNLDPEDLAALAERAADADDFGRAAKLAEAARARSPTSRRLALDHAYYLSRSGDLARALRALDERPLREDADAHLLAARLHLEAGHEDASAARLRRALQRAPVIVLDVESDPAFQPLMLRSDVADAVRKAHASLR